MNDDELYHYGVLGMKWGVRRNSRVLANHRANSKNKEISKKYKSGEISSRTAKKMMKEVNKNRRADAKKLTASVHSKADAKKLMKQTVKEVPHSKVKKGMRTINHILTGGTLAGQAVSATIGTLANPALGSLVISSNVVMGLANVGRSKLIDRVIDAAS